MILSDRFMLCIFMVWKQLYTIHCPKLMESTSKNYTLPATERNLASSDVLIVGGYVQGSIY